MKTHWRSQSNGKLKWSMEMAKVWSKNLELKFKPKSMPKIKPKEEKAVVMKHSTLSLLGVHQRGAYYGTLHPSYM